MNELIADVRFFSLRGEWIVDLTRGGTAAANSFTPQEIRAVAELWKWLAEISSLKTPDLKWCQTAQSITLQNSGSWYLGSERIA